MFSSWTGRGFGAVCDVVLLLLALPLVKEDASPSFTVGRAGVPCGLGANAPMPRSFPRIEVFRPIEAKKPLLPALELETTLLIAGCVAKVRAASPGYGKAGGRILPLSPSGRRFVAL